MFTRITTLAVAATVASCATIDPRSAQQLATAELQHVDEFRYQVPMPLAVAWRNTLARARECWQQTAGFPYTTTWFVEADPFQQDLGYARISVRVDRLVPTVVTLTPIDGSHTLIVARRIKMTGGHHASHRDLPNLALWAQAMPSPCRDRLVM